MPNEAAEHTDRQRQRMAASARRQHRERMRETDFADNVNRPKKRPRRFGELRNLVVPDNSCLADR
jgi:hypothetical protein